MAQHLPAVGTGASRRAPAIFSLALLAGLALAIALLPTRAAASPGWDVVLDQPTPDFSGIDFPTPDEGWLVAGAGLLHSSDGGATWDENAKLTGNDVDFVDADHGWLVGGDGAIWGTTDAGENWTAQDSGTFVHLADVVAVSTTEAWATGSHQGYSDAITVPIPTALLHTTDGGASWEQIETPPNTWFRKIVFVGAQGWALGTACPNDPDVGYCNFSFHDALLYTADAGATWSLIDTLPAENVSDFAFVDGMHGWLIGEDDIFRTTDAGETWESTNVSQFGSPYKLQFVTETVGWAIAQLCDNSRCLLNTLRSDDGGVSWISLSVIDLAPFQYLRNFSVQGPALYVTGGDLAQRSSSGGLSWQEMSTPALRLANLDFVTEDVGFAASGPTLIRSDDAGASWEAVGRAPGFVRILDFIDASTGFSASNSCGTACGPNLERTTDGGRTWTTVHPTTEVIGFPRRLQFADRQHGWLVTEAWFVLTSDGGSTWEEVRLPVEIGETILEADLVDATHGWVIAQGPAPDYARRLASTNDGGRSWQVVPTATFAPAAFSSFLDFVDHDHGWYTDTVCAEQCRVTVYRTLDGGQSWSTKELGVAPIRDMVFADALNGWINGSLCDDFSCSPEEVLHTADGGETWASQLSDDLLLGEFQFVDVRHGWFALDERRGMGIGGGPPNRTVLYRTTDGGGGPIGELPTPPPKIPDVGTGPGDSSSYLPVFVLLLASGAFALCAGAFVAKRR